MMPARITSLARWGITLKSLNTICNLHYIRKWNHKYFQFCIRNFCSQSENIPIENVRNFCIIAHVDHGKSTLADRFLEITGAIDRSKENKQVLDRLPVERERGITVKAVAASLYYNYKGINYELNLIDTPGHVDFSNEVSRSLSACQGVILLIDSNEGVQAQTIANFYLAFTKELTILPVLNKIDLPHADPERVEKELKSLLDIDPSTVRRVSAKTGFGVEDLLKLVIEKVPHPKVNRSEPFQCLIIDSWYCNFRGTILFVYVKGGAARVGDAISSHTTGMSYQIKSTSKLCPQEKNVKELRAGEVGIISCNMKESKEAHVGDTLYAKGKNVENAPAVSSPTPMVFAGLYPRNESEYNDLKAAMDKLLLNDASVTVSPDSTPALGKGWTLGFLGSLHLDVFRQRLEQEFDKEVILSAPSVTYKLKILGAKNIKKYRGDEISIKNPSHFPDPNIIKEMYEPVALTTIIAPLEHQQVIHEECSSRRGIERDSVLITGNRILLKFLMPLNEIILDFHDKLKNITSGYASMDYEDAGYMPTSLEKLIILLNGKEVEELVQIVHVGKKYEIARKMVTKLKQLVPRQQVGIMIQAVVRGKVLAREDIKPYRKDVAGDILYGGDMTRRQKLLRAQREGKKRMRQIANIQIPKDTFVEVLKEY